MIKTTDKDLLHSHFMISQKNVLKGPKEWGGAILHKKTLIKTIWENMILDIPAVI
jgi:hypothetical protein